MALTAEELGYGVGRAGTPSHVEAERQEAGVGAMEREGARIGEVVQRINYNGTDVEIVKIDHARLGRPVDKQYERNKASVESRLRAIGVHVATVVNFLPYQLRTDSLLGPSRVARIMPPKDGEDFAVYVFSHAYIEPGRRGMDSPLLATEWHPIQMANEFSRIYLHGVFSFLGVPSDIEDLAWKARISEEPDHNGMTYGAAIEASRQGAIAYMHDKVREGKDRTRQNLPWSNVHKACAQRLHSLGFLKELPKEVEKERDFAVVIPVCPKCQKPCEPGAASCTNGPCGYIINPRKAYEISAIGEDDLSLERLTRAEVKEMGISDYVIETIDEKKNRLASGGIRPVHSLAAQRIKDADEDWQTAQANRNATLTGEAIGKSLRANGKEAKEETPPKE